MAIKERVIEQQIEETGQACQDPCLQPSDNPTPFRLETWKDIAYVAYITRMETCRQGGGHAGREVF